MKRKILLSAAFIVLAISCVFAEQYTAQVILNIQDDTKVAWTSEEYNGEKDFVPISEPVELEENENREFSSYGTSIFASGSSNLDVGAAKIKIYGTPLYEDENDTDSEKINYKIISNGDSGENTSTYDSSSMDYGVLLMEFSNIGNNSQNQDTGVWEPWVFSVPITIETVGNAQDTVNKMAGGTSLTGTLTLCVESS